MRSKTKRKLILMCLGVLISLSFVFNSNIAYYPGKLSENSANTTQKNLKNPHISTNGGFKIHWKANGTTLTNSQDITDDGGYYMISDGEGGAIIAWVDDYAGTWDIYAQKINSEGTRLWGLNGTIICNAIDIQSLPQICSDGEGGAIITWEDSRTAIDDIYAQHINSDGIIEWGESFWSGPSDLNGTVICNATGKQSPPQICSDEDEGAIITWEDSRSATKDIYAQYINSDGITQWGESFWSGPSDLNGTVICNATGQQSNPQICSDEDEGAIITWEDSRSATKDIYAQHINSDGITQWGESFWSGPSDLNGTVICNATGKQSRPQICSDGDEGAIITWEDPRSVIDDIYAQHINSDGISQWGESFWSGPSDLNGTVICNATDVQSRLQICSDEDGGAIITWEDGRAGFLALDIYIQWVDSQGISHWGDGSLWGGKIDLNGTAICINKGATFDYISSSICSDNSGGMIVAWYDERGTGMSMYAQRVRIRSPGGVIPAGDDDDDDDEDTGVVVVVIVIIILACGGGVVVVIIVLIKKGLIDVSKLKKG